MGLTESINTNNSLKITGNANNINESVNYTANTGVGVVSVANTSLNGTGTLTDILVTAATANSVGTLVKKVIIKASTSATRGMVRLFVYDGTNTRLIEEFEVSGVVQNNIQACFEVSYDVDWSFGPGITIRASTENAERFIVAIEALDLIYP